MKHNESEFWLNKELIFVVMFFMFLIILLIKGYI